MGTISALLPVFCSKSNNHNHARDASFTRRAAEIADKSAGFSAPHPNFGCVIAKGEKVVGEGFLYAPGTKCAELQAVEAARELSNAATAYMNMEPGDCLGDQTAVSALINAGISRVVVGLRHPLQHLRGKAIQSLRGEGVEVVEFDILNPQHLMEYCCDRGYLSILWEHGGAAIAEGYPKGHMSVDLGFHSHLYS